MAELRQLPLLGTECRIGSKTKKMVWSLQAKRVCDVVHVLGHGGDDGPAAFVLLLQLQCLLRL
jgi:hypothetical protein